MNRAQIGGRALEYEVRGAGESVVLVHGSHIADAFVLRHPRATGAGGCSHAVRKGTDHTRGRGRSRPVSFGR
jgi:hypothetical protein